MFVRPLYPGVHFGARSPDEGSEFVMYESGTSESRVQTVFRLNGRTNVTETHCQFVSVVPVPGSVYKCYFLFVKYSCKMRYVIVQHGLDRIWNIIWRRHCSKWKHTQTGRSHSNVGRCISRAGRMLYQHI